MTSPPASASHEPNVSHGGHACHNNAGGTRGGKCYDADGDGDGNDDDSEDAADEKKAGDDYDDLDNEHGDDDA